MYKAIGKRFLDFFAAATGLIILSPLLLLTALTIMMVDRSLPLYIQRRPGLHEKIFGIIKFRTMTQQCDMAGTLLPDELRITSLGRVLRKFSIDELPQLWNVLTGDMSLVGPRPLLIEYLPRYNNMQRKRHDVRPGITGWAQVNGRNQLLFEKKLELDVWYTEQQSFRLDVRIIIMTMMEVFKGADQSF